MHALRLKCQIVSSKPFFRSKSPLALSTLLGLQARDADGWFFMVGQKVI